MPKSNIGGDLDAIEKRLEKLRAGNDKIENMFKKKRQEFETINQGLWEGKKIIDDNQKDLKKEKDTKKIQELAGEIEEAEKTFKKMTTKLAGIVKELSDMGTTGANLEKTIREEDKNLDQLEKDIKRTGGQVDELKEWDATIKKLRKNVNAEALRAFTIKDEVKNLPNTPKL